MCTVYALYLPSYPTVVLASTDFFNDSGQGCGNNCLLYKRLIRMFRLDQIAEADLIKSGEENGQHKTDKNLLQRIGIDNGTEYNGKKRTTFNRFLGRCWVSLAFHDAPGSSLAASAFCEGSSGEACGSEDMRKINLVDREGPREEG